MTPLADASTTMLDLTPYLNFGVLGLVVLSLITGWLWTKPSVDRLVKEKERAVREKDKAIAQRDAMALVLQEKLLPVVGDFIVTTRVLLPVMQEMHQLQQIAPLLEELIRSGEVASVRKRAAGRARRPSADE